MTRQRNTQVTGRIPSSLERVRVRARLLEVGVTARAVAAHAGVTESITSHVLAGRRSATSPKGRLVVGAAESLSGLSWAELTAPPVARAA